MKKKSSIVKNTYENKLLLARNFAYKSNWIKSLYFYEELLKKFPNDSQILFELSFVYMQLTEFQKAYICMEKILQERVNDAEFLSNFGVVCSKLNMLEKAEYLLKFAIKLNPNRIDYLLNISSIFNSQEKFNEALINIRLALKLNSLHKTSYLALGVTLLKIGEIESAQDAFNIALAIDPNCPIAKFNSATIHSRIGNDQNAINIYEDLLRQPIVENSGVAIQPIKFSLSLMYLKSGKIRKGWEYYEEGFHPSVAPEYRRNPTRHFSKPKWNGSVKAGKTILIWREQGVGDEILFMSCLPDLLGSELQIIIECDKRLVPIISRSFPNCLVREESIKLNSNIRESLFDDYDFHLPLGSLMHIYRNDLNLFKNKLPYFKVDNNLTLKMKNALVIKGSTKKRIGICWRSSYINQERILGYTNLNNWKPIFSVKEFDFVNLQYGECEEEIIEAESLFNTKIIRWSDLDLKNDFESTMALISNLDLVVTVATAVNPMAASIGVPVFLMSVYDWPNLGTNYYPWFENVTCFFPKLNSDVNSCIPDVAKAIEQSISS